MPLDAMCGSKGTRTTSAQVDSKNSTHSGSGSSTGFVSTPITCRPHSSRPQRRSSTSNSASVGASVAAARSVGTTTTSAHRIALVKFAAVTVFPVSITTCVNS